MCFINLLLFYKIIVSCVVNILAVADTAVVVVVVNDLLAEN